MNMKIALSNEHPINTLAYCPFGCNKNCQMFMATFFRLYFHPPKSELLPHSNYNKEIVDGCVNYGFKEKI